MEWERIDDWNERAPVFGGWIVKTTESVCHVDVHNCVAPVDGYDWRISTCFVPDPSGEWVITARVKEVE